MNAGREGGGRAAPRILLPPGGVTGDQIVLEGEVLRHVRTVLRLREGDTVRVADGSGFEYAARLGRLGRDRGEAAVIERREPRRESPLRTVLAQAVPKGDRFELALEKAVELGVTAVVPLLTRRTVPGAGGAGRLERWRRVVAGAVAQSGRTLVPQVHRPRTLEEYLGEPGQERLRLLLWEGAREGLREALGDAAAPGSVVVAVGPEGGWEEGEAARAVARGFRAVGMGPRILRSETAGLAALAVLQHRWGDLG